MKNTPENKERFFALYWGQNIQLFRGHLYNIVDPNCGDSIKLQPLSQITDEDAIEVSKIYDAGQNLNLELHSLRGKRIIKNKSYNSYLTDYLRSKGYALPWLGISVEQQIEWGWIKLKE